MKSYSQAGQDRFVYEILGRMIDGTFLDVGAHDGVKHSNSLGLEELGWRGLLVDIQSIPSVFKRKSDVHICDAVTADWAGIFKVYFPDRTEIDYLSLDVDDATTDTLYRLLQEPMRYRVITVEHDQYRIGPATRRRQIEYLAKAGYDLMCSNVCVGPGEWGPGGPFEDWWCCKDLMTEDNCRRFLCDNQLGTTIVTE